MNGYLIIRVLFPLGVCFSSLFYRFLVIVSLKCGEYNDIQLAKWRRSNVMFTFYKIFYVDYGFANVNFILDMRIY